MRRVYGLLLAFVPLLVAPMMLFSGSLSIGEEYVWDVRVNEDALESLRQEANVIDDFRFSADLTGIKLSINDIEDDGSDEIITADYYTQSEESPMEWEANEDEQEFRVKAYDTQEYSAGEVIFDLIYCELVIVPDDVNWKEWAIQINDTLSKDNSLEEFEVEAESSGLTLSLTYADQKEISVEVLYSPKGVIALYWLSYDGDLVASMEMHDMLIDVLLWIALIAVIVGLSVAIFLLVKHKLWQKHDHQEKTEKELNQGDNNHGQGGEPQFTCVKTLTGNKIPDGLRIFIAEQQEPIGIIRPENLPKSFLKEGIVYCRYEHEEKMIVNCFTQKLEE